MAMFFERSIRKDNEEYKVVMNLNDAAIMDDSAKFEIVAKKRLLPDGDWVDETLEINIQFKNRQIVISRKGIEKPIAILPLNTPLDESHDFEGNDIDIEKDDKIITQYLCNSEGTNLCDKFGVDFVERIISSIPTDPFLGCLLKGAVSTAVGQVIRCWIPVRKMESYREMASHVCGCLREHSKRMLFTFMYRSGKCIVTCGLTG